MRIKHKFYYDFVLISRLLQMIIATCSVMVGPSADIFIYIYLPRVLNKEVVIISKSI